jgi:hypothetical protein
MNPCTDTGGRNTAVGYQALKAHTAGVGNTAMGSNALVTQTGAFADYSTAIGYRSLQSNTVKEMTAVGAYALSQNTLGAGSTAVGTYALSVSTTGDNNTALGTQALSKLDVAGSGNNVAVGTNALMQFQGGSKNVGIGANCGYEASTMGPPSNSVIIGSDANSYQSNSIAIGASAVAQPFQDPVVPFIGTNGATGTVAIGSSGGINEDGKLLIVTDTGLSTITDNEYLPVLINGSQYYFKLWKNSPSPI